MWASILISRDLSSGLMVNKDLTADTAEKENPSADTAGKENPFADIIERESSAKSADANSGRGEKRPNAPSKEIPPPEILCPHKHSFGPLVIFLNS
ncbi:hypothetical protein L3X38_042034 [Prunus dulcis]|uniref:Uncharacterized protein n=1 Tax=Prunus dulcis TaxID=3755 RepID=A0AAD4UU31_PRUDU|nr:hypothetical protein L3X38_042034 [Prunus dulcis]